MGLLAALAEIAWFIGHGYQQQQNWGHSSTPLSTAERRRYNTMTVSHCDLLVSKCSNINTTGYLCRPSSTVVKQYRLGSSIRVCVHHRTGHRAGEGATGTSRAVSVLLPPLLGDRHSTDLEASAAPASQYHSSRMFQNGNGIPYIMLPTALNERLLEL